MTKHYIEYSFPGFLFAESSTKEVKSRKVPKKLPKNCFAFRFFDRTETEIDGEKLQGQAKNWSPMHLIGKEYTIDQVVQMKPNETILHSNIRGNSKFDPPTGVLCVAGNWQVRDEDTIIIDPDTIEFEK